MARNVAIGIQSFEEIIKDNCFYIDKTDFIKEWWDSKDSVTLITRPRRFGKALNMSMIEQFFSVNYAGRGDWFEGLSIWQNEDYRHLQGTYPVISLSFARVKEDNFQKTREKICEILTKLYVQHSYLRDSDILTKADKLFFDRMLEAEIKDSDATSSLHQLSDYLQRYYGKKVIILLDEYDTPMQEAYVNGYWDECGLSEHKDGVKAWYDGFVFGKHSDIYNPWSVLNFLDTNGEYDTYWANTSGNRLVSKLIREGNPDIKELFELLLKGEVIRCPIDEQIVYNQLDEDEDAIWSLLVASGYLKVLAYEKLNMIPIGKRALYDLQLTNGEVQRMFLNMISGWFTPAKRQYNEFIKALLSQDIDAMNELINHVSCEIFSSFDTGRRVSKESQPERFYHGFVLGVLVELQCDYILTSNRESGFGRYDVMLEPRDKRKNAYIFEFKVHKPKRESNLAETVENALKQIEEKQYEADLVARGIPKENIFKYGFAFKGKEVLIGSPSC